MTENEAVEILKNNFPKTCKMVDGRYKGGFDDTECEFGQALLLSISALEEIQQYRAIGTVEEIKEILQIISEGQDDVEESGISTGLLHTLLEYAEYAKIGTVEEYREAREIQISRKPIKEKIFKTTGYYQCPICGCLLRPHEKFCEDCGQKLDWSE